jgi:hypothetical protein
MVATPEHVTAGDRDTERERDLETVAWSAGVGSNVPPPSPQEKSRADDRTRTNCITCLIIRSLLLAKDSFTACLPQQKQPVKPVMHRDFQLGNIIISLID